MSDRYRQAGTMSLDTSATPESRRTDGRFLVRVLRAGWFQIFVSGLVLFYLIDKTMVSTRNPNFIPSLILVGAFLVPVTLVSYLGGRAQGDPLPLSTVAVCFLWGGASGVIIAGILEYRTLRDLGPLTLLGVGVIEESAKLLVPLILYIRGRYRSEMSGITFGVAAGMGFAALETMGYAFVAFIQSGGNIGTLEETLLVRGLLSPAGHAAWTGLICAVLWRERARLGRPVINRAVVGAFALAVVLHALWDMFNSLRGPTFVDWLGVELISLGIAIISLTLLIRRVREAEQRSAPLVEAETPPSPAS